MQDGLCIAKQRGRDRQTKIRGGREQPRLTIRQRYEREIENRYGGQSLNDNDGGVVENSDEEDSHTDDSRNLISFIL